MFTFDEALQKLHAKANPARLAGMAKYGLGSKQRLGLSVPEMRALAKELGRDHALALKLWKTGILEAQIIASMIAVPDKLTEKQADRWVKDIYYWDVCDQLCGNLLWKTPFAWNKVSDWSERQEEFVRRAAFALLAVLAVHDKQASDEQFISTFPLMDRAATDERLYVKKGVNWALRQIGKRNRNLNKAAIRQAEKLKKLDSKAARWIASDALRELKSAHVLVRFKK